MLLLLLQVRAKLQAFRGGELANAPFRIVKQTGAPPAAGAATAAATCCALTLR
jgi:hypothetical protein